MKRKAASPQTNDFYIHCKYGKNNSLYQLLFNPLNHSMKITSINMTPLKMKKSWEEIAFGTFEELAKI